MYVCVYVCVCVCMYVCMYVCRLLRMDWTLVCVLYMRHSLERTVKKKVSMLTGILSPGYYIGILGVYNDIRRGTEMCIIWMF